MFTGRPINPKFSLLGIASLALLLACSVNVKKDKNGGDKNVDIHLPAADLHVTNNADVRDTGLTVYPGARVKQKEENGNEKSANVNLSFGDYGLKVVAVEYESDDAPDKVLDFYKTQLKKFGNVLECHVHGRHVNMNHEPHSNSLSCEESGGSTIELKVGTEENQHIVSIEPQDKGCNFGLVRVQTHGKDTI